MSMSDWLYAQASLTEQALEEPVTPEHRDYLVRRLHELQGRIRFEQRAQAQSPDTSAVDDF